MAAWRPAKALICKHYKSIESHMNLLLEAREITALAYGNQFHKVSEEYWILPNFHKSFHNPICYSQGNICFLNGVPYLFNEYKIWPKKQTVNDWFCIKLTIGCQGKKNSYNLLSWVRKGMQPGTVLMSPIWTYITKTELFASYNWVIVNTFTWTNSRVWSTF